MMMNYLTSIMTLFQLQCMVNIFLPAARNVPEQILAAVLRCMGDKWKTLDPNRIAPLLYSEKVITHDDYYQLCNRHIPPGERINNLVFTILPHSGDQRNVLVVFYHCLLKTGYPGLAREVQQRGIQIIASFITFCQLYINA